MHIDEIQNGIVIDHIKAGKGMELYHFLHLENWTAPLPSCAM